MYVHNNITVSHMKTYIKMSAVFPLKVYAYSQNKYKIIKYNIHFGAGPRLSLTAVQQVKGKTP